MFCTLCLLLSLTRSSDSPICVQEPFSQPATFLLFLVIYFLHFSLICAAPNYVNILRANLTSLGKYIFIFTLASLINEWYV